MLISEWASTRNYAWTRYKFSSTEEPGTVLLTAPWGIVRVTSE